MSEREERGREERRRPAPEVRIDELIREVSEAGKSFESARSGADELSRAIATLALSVVRLRQSIESSLAGTVESMNSVMARLASMRDELTRAREAIAGMRDVFAVVPPKILESVEQFGVTADTAARLKDVMDAVAKSIAASGTDASSAVSAVAKMFADLARMRVFQPAEAALYGLTELRASASETARVMSGLPEIMRQMVQERPELRTAVADIAGVMAGIVRSFSESLARAGVPEPRREEILKQLLTSLVNQSAQLVREVAESRNVVLARLDRAAHRMIEPVSRGMAEFTRAFAYMVPGLGQFLMLGGMFVGMVQGIRDVATTSKAIMDYVREMPSVFRIVGALTHDKIKEFMSLVRTYLVYLLSLDFWRNVWNSLSAAIGGALGAAGIGAAVAKITGALSSAGAAISSFGASVSAAVSSVSGLLLSIAGIVAGLAGAGGLAEAVGLTAEHFRRASAGTAQLADVMRDKGNAFSEGLMRASSSIYSFSATVYGFAESLPPVIREIVKGLAVLGAAPAVISEIIGRAADWMRDTFVGAGQTVAGAVAGVVDRLRDAFGSVARTISSWTLPRVAEAREVEAGAGRLVYEYDRTLANAISRLAQAVERERTVKVEPKVEVKVEVDRGVRYVR
ncbi:MAG: hypothetical protein QXX12_00030 [Nanopusillaceae archaeon]